MHSTIGAAEPVEVDAPSVSDYETMSYIEQIPVFTVQQADRPVWALALKRVTDIFVSAIGLVLISPFLAVVAIAVKIDSPGPILYRSVRVGKKGKTFVFFKFRSMLASADELKADLSHLNEREGPLFKLKNDPRVTKLGRFLRKYSIDEIPQLWNVLEGNMSLVGPRPPTMDEYEQYQLHHLDRLDVLPGITGLWQISARQHPSFDKAVALDIEYIRTWRLALDYRILLRTIPAVFKGTGS